MTISNIFSTDSGKLPVRYNTSCCTPHLLSVLMKFLGVGKCDFLGNIVHQQAKNSATRHVESMGEGFASASSHFRAKDQQCFLNERGDVSLGQCHNVVFGRLIRAITERTFDRSFEG